MYKGIYNFHLTYPTKPFFLQRESTTFKRIDEFALSCDWNAVKSKMQAQLQESVDIHPFILTLIIVCNMDPLSCSGIMTVSGMHMILDALLICSF